MKTRDRPKILCLGMSYPDVIGQMQHEGFKSGILIHDKPCVLQAVECVRRNILTEMDGRDLARCLAMEQKLKVAAYTVSQELGSVYLKSKHLHGNFNRASFVKALRNAFGESVRFRQILLDYFWIPQGTWVMTHWGKSFFQVTLPLLVDILEVPQEKNDSAIEIGVIFLPFCFHCCKQIVAALSTLDQYYEISFVKKDELHMHALWNGTSDIDPRTMQEVLGKQINQEDFYCTFSPRDVAESMEDCTVTKENVIKYLRCIEDFDQVRMIRLKPVREKYRKTGMHEGGFVGLVKPFKVQRGYDFLVTGGSKVTDSSDSSEDFVEEEIIVNRVIPRKKPRKDVRVETITRASKSATISGETQTLKRQRLFTMVEDLESYKLLDSSTKLVKQYTIHKSLENSLFPDFRRTYNDVVTNQHVSRQFDATMIDFLSTKIDAKFQHPMMRPCDSNDIDRPLDMDDTEDKPVKKETLARHEYFIPRYSRLDEEIAVKLLLVKRNLHIYTGVNPKVARYEREEGSNKANQEKNQEGDILSSNRRGQIAEDSTSCENYGWASILEEDKDKENLMKCNGRSLRARNLIWDIDDNPTMHDINSNVRLSATMLVNRKDFVLCCDGEFWEYHDHHDTLGLEKVKQKISIPYSNSDRLFDSFETGGEIRDILLHLKNAGIV